MLLQAQLLALVVVVLGIEHLGDDLAELLFLQGLHILAPVELLHVDLLGRAGRPGAQHVDHGAVIAQYRHIIGHGLHGFIVQMAVFEPAVLVIFLKIAPEMHLHRLGRPADFPHIAVFQPVVGQLHLISVHDVLAEQAVFIADGAAHGRQLQGGQRVQKTGRQPAQAAVAQAGLGLLLEDDGFIHLKLVQGLAVGPFVDQGHHVVVQRPPGQKLGGKVIEFFCLLLFALAPAGRAAGHDLVAHRGGQRLIQLGRGGVRDFASEMALELADNGGFDFLLAKPF